MTINPKLLEPTLLWENSNPNDSYVGSSTTETSFTGGNVANFKYVVVAYRVTADANVQPQYLKFSNDTGYRYISYADSGVSMARNVYLNKAGNSFRVSVCYKKVFDSTGIAQDNDKLVPVAIFGTNTM